MSVSQTMEDAQTLARTQPGPLTACVPVALPSMPMDSHAQVSRYLSLCSYFDLACT